MKKNLFYFLSAFLLIFAAGCSDMADVEPTVDQNTLKESTEANAPDQNPQGENLKTDQIQKIEGKGLKNLKVTGELGDDDGTFDGMVTITSFSYDEELGLLANGEIKGIATLDGTKTHVKETFTNAPVTLADADAAANAKIAAECQILFLDIGPIFLDLLGLQVDLSQIVLDITAVSGSGNLLGNLLCAVAGLLDPLTGLLAFLNDLIELLDLLEQINELLSL